MSFLKSSFKKLFKAAEDPRQSAVYTDERQRAMLVKVRGLLAEIDQSRQQLTAKTAVLAKKMDILETRACADLKNGRENSARQRLQQQQIIAVEQQAIQAKISELDQKEQRLLRAEHKLVTHIEAYIVRRKTLKARYNMSESQVVLNKGMKKVFNDLADLEEMIEVAETQTDYMEARASLLDEDMDDMWWLELNTAVVTTPSTESVLNADLNKMVETELARLKKQVDV